MASHVIPQPDEQTWRVVGDQPLRIGIIGAGMFAATSHLPALRECPGVEVTCACRTREAKLKRFCETFGVPRGYTDHREMLARERLDGVVVASTHDLHFAHAMDCLERGIPVLLEKPMTLTMADADALLARTRETRLPVVIGYNRHWWPCYVRAREMIQGGQLGEPRVLIGEYCGDLEWAIARDAESNYGRSEAFYEAGDPPNFRGDWEKSGGGFFIDAGTHIAEVICWLIDDDPVLVHAVMDSRGHETDLDGLVSVRFRSGTLATIYFMGSAKAHAGSGVTVYGSGGTLIARHDSELHFAPEGELLPIADLPEKSHPAHNFVAVLRGTATPACTVADGRRAVALVSAAYQSASEGAAVETALA
ncbi:Gfo/Idh/MocA family oxidoreductase [Candidatus Sumerlaeota bacterium]|nr:Gfo/Idh/MocA family oxidoreductase [Candidatus Sumerlaeota bacterium]